jgi:predicted  nucleic acid-binding Zn-ribbon protein
MKQFLEHAVDTIEKSYRALEHKCVNAVNELGKLSKEKIDEQAECLGRLNAVQEEQNDRIVYTHRLADSGGYKTRDGTVMVGEIGERVKALELQVTDLQEQNKMLREKEHTTN